MLYYTQIIELLRRITTAELYLQWRGQDLLRGGGKLESGSWGTHYGELQGRMTNSFVTNVD